MANTGIKKVLTLRKYLDGEPIDVYKPNVEADADYVAPYLDLSGCPLSDPVIVPPTTNPPGATTNTHVVTDSDTTIADSTNITTLLEGETSTYNFSIYAPSGYYWSSIPTFTADATGCSASASIVAGSNNTQLFIVVSLTQQADATTITYTYSSSANLTAVPVQDSITWSSGTSNYVSSSGESPKVLSITGTVTVVGADAQFRASAMNIFNYVNGFETELIVNGSTYTASTVGDSNTQYSSTGTLSAGTYSYTLKGTLTLSGGTTSGAAVAAIQNL